MSYFKKINDCRTYSASKDDFHFDYNGNKGGGQPFLAGNFSNEEGELSPSNSLKGKRALFRFEIGSQNIILENDKYCYFIKPRSENHTSVKLEIESENKEKKIHPSSLISTFLMLPETCCVKNPTDINAPILTKNNYWIHSMWLSVSTNSKDNNKVFFTLRDCIACGGIRSKGKVKEGAEKFFMIDFKARIRDIIKLASSNNLDSDISNCVKFFASMYKGETKFDYTESAKKINDLMEKLNEKYERYNGSSDPLTFIKKITSPLHPVILYGPPGTGKTFRMQKDYIDDYKADDKFITTFHQSFCYEDFVEGLKPVIDEKDATSDVKYHVEKGVFYNACIRAAELAGYMGNALQECIDDPNRSKKINAAIRDNKIVLFCIDEINRANVSSVFGDLISMIEPSKRIGADHEMIVQLPYSKKKFGIPGNLQIVGTMNTTDRSIQLLDSALRRRFHFEELPPDSGVVGYPMAKNILETINMRIRCFLNKDYQIGHSYFIDVQSDLDLLTELRKSVIPLLEEYFFSDPQKIRLILNDSDNDDYNFYIKDSEANKYLESLSLDDEYEPYVPNPKLDMVITDNEANKFLDHILR